jgi:DNA-binding MarR family transcriptional regulator
MALKEELHFPHPIRLLPHEVLLSVYHTSSCIKKEADRLFRRFGMTDVQFNLMMLLRHQTGPEGGLTQSQISEMMLVNRANVTCLIDRMEKTGLVCRTAATGDRRVNVIRLTERGEELLNQVEPEYAGEISRRMEQFSLEQQQELLDLLEKIRHVIATK